MFDVDLIRQNREIVEDMLKRRNADAPLDDILALDDKRLDLVREINRLREERNRITQQIPGCKDAAENRSLLKPTESCVKES